MAATTATPNADVSFMEIGTAMLRLSIFALTVSVPTRYGRCTWTGRRVADWFASVMKTISEATKIRTSQKSFLDANG